MPRPELIGPKRQIVLELVKLPFQSNRNAFCIAKGVIRWVDEHGKADAIGKPLTAKGDLHNPIIGAHYKLTGHTVFEKDFGEYQFHFSSYEVNQTATTTGMQNYLAKECPGIGETRARQLVEVYGEETMTKLAADDVYTLAEITIKVPGINLQEAENIREWAKKESVLLPVKQRLYEAGMTQGLIKTLTVNYGTKTEEVLSKECFTITELRGIGFATADKLAVKFGMSPTNPERIKQGVLHAMTEVMDDQGHTCVDHHILINAACKLLGIHKSHVIKMMQLMIEKDELCTDRTDPRKVSKYSDLFIDDEEKPCQTLTPSAASEVSSLKPSALPESTLAESSLSLTSPQSAESATAKATVESSSETSAMPATAAALPVLNPALPKPFRRNARLG